MTWQLEYSLGLLVFWLGLIYVVVALFRGVGDDTTFIVTDPYGAIYGGGEFVSEAGAMALREELIAHGIECWIVPIERGSYTEEDGPC